MWACSNDEAFLLSSPIMMSCSAILLACCFICESLSPSIRNGWSYLLESGLLIDASFYGLIIGLSGLIIGLSFSRLKRLASSDALRCLSWTKFRSCISLLRAVSSLDRIRSAANKSSNLFMSVLAALLTASISRLCLRYSLLKSLACSNIYIPRSRIYYVRSFTFFLYSARILSSVSV